MAMSFRGGGWCKVLFIKKKLKSKKKVPVAYKLEEEEGGGEVRP